jgi:hypothetical protein
VTVTAAFASQIVLFPSVTLTAGKTTLSVVCNNGKTAEKLIKYLK